jgi:hypothetical protein
VFHHRLQAAEELLRIETVDVVLDLTAATVTTSRSEMLPGNS